MFTFPVLDQKTLFGQIWSKDQNCQFKLKFGTKTNLNLRDSMMMFTFSVFDHKYLTWANLVQNIKFVCSKWNLIQRLIPMCKIQWWCVFCLLETENSYPFWTNLVQNVAIVSLSWKFECEEFNSDVYFFLFSTESIIFLKFDPKIKIVYWSWNLESRLIWVYRIRW